MKDHKNEDNPQNKDNHKIEDEPKIFLNEDETKFSDNLKNDEIPKMDMTLKEK